jgi:hypothetical protein
MASTSLVRTQLKYLPVAVQRKTKKETKKTIAIEGKAKPEARRGRNEAEENQPEQRRSEKYKQRRHRTHSTIQDPSSLWPRLDPNISPNFIM